MWGFLLAGLALFAVAAKLHFWLGRRQFERRSSAGIEGFEDYSSMVKIRIKKGIAFGVGMVVSLFGVYVSSFTCWHWPSDTRQN